MALHVSGAAAPLGDMQRQWGDMQRQKGHTAPKGGLGRSAARRHCGAFGFSARESAIKFRFSACAGEGLSEFRFSARERAIKFRFSACAGGISWELLGGFIASTSWDVVGGSWESLAVFQSLLGACASLLGPLGCHLAAWGAAHLRWAIARGSCPVPV